MNEPLIHRQTLRDQIRDAIRKRIIRGDLAAEAKLVETDLAQELGVSRTPLREALIALEQEGFLEALPGRGFSVLPLDAEEYRDLAEIIGHLEAFALGRSAPPTPRQIQELRTANDELRQASDIQDPQQQADRRLQADLTFHNILLDQCPNQKLLDLLNHLKQQWRRYEYAFWSTVTTEARSADQHAGIIEALAANDLPEAARRLEANWQCWRDLKDVLNKLRDS